MCRLGNFWRAKKCFFQLFFHHFCAIPDELSCDIPATPANTLGSPLPKENIKLFNSIYCCRHSTACSVYFFVEFIASCAPCVRICEGIAFFCNVNDIRSNQSENNSLGAMEAIKMPLWESRHYWICLPINYSPNKLLSGASGYFPVEKGNRINGFINFYKRRRFWIKYVSNNTINGPEIFNKYILYRNVSVFCNTHV